MPLLPVHLVAFAAAAGWPAADFPAAAAPHRAGGLLAGATAGDGLRPPGGLGTAWGDPRRRGALPGGRVHLVHTSEAISLATPYRACLKITYQQIARRCQLLPPDILHPSILW
jgi:hypothetical protein